MESKMTSKDRNWFHAAMLLSLLCFGCSLLMFKADVYAEKQTGWVEEEDGYRYYLKDGSVYATVVDHWKTFDGNTYYILADGRRKTGALTLNGKKYFMDRNGVRVTGWMQSPVNQSVWYYFDERWGCAVTGSRNIKGKYYYFRTSGVRVNGFYKNGKIVFLTDTETGVALQGLHQASNGNYYFLNQKGQAQCGFQKTNSSGSIRYFDPETRAMRTGKLILNGKIYYLNSNGIRRTGWFKTGSNWYYFDSKTGAASIGFRTINGNTYYFNANGVAVSGFKSIQGKKYYFDPSTRIQYKNRRPVIINGKYYDIPSSGVVTQISEGRYYAEKKLNQIGWNLSAAYRYSVGFSYNAAIPEPAAGEDFAAFYAAFGFTHGYGHCYVYAGTFYEMAKALGYDAHFVKGYVSSSSGGLVTHGWVEIVEAGSTYLYDPNFEFRTGRNGYRFVLGTSGWDYTNYHRIN